ncbi:24208_t:CDS:2, partial [Gigaspora margarita]
MNMFSSNKRKSISSKSVISQTRDNNPSTKITTTTTTKTPPLPQREPIEEDIKPSNATNDLPSILKPSTSYNKIPTKSSSLPIKVNQSNNDESSNSKSDSTSSTIKPSGYSLIVDKPRRNRSSTIFSGTSISESKSSVVRGSMIGESPTRLPRKHKRTGSAPILNVTSMSLPMSLTNNLNKISSTKSMTNLNEFEAKIDRETPKQYLERMMYGVSRSKLVTILTQKADAFHQSALKAYMELFEFEKVPIDLAL